MSRKGSRINFQKTRVQVDLGPKTLEMLSEIMSELECSTLSETFRYLIREYRERMKNSKGTIIINESKEAPGVLRAFSLPPTEDS